MTKSSKKLVTILLFSVLVLINPEQLANGQDRGSREISRDSKYHLNKDTPWYKESLKRKKILEDYSSTITNRIYANWLYDGIEDGRAVILFTITKEGEVTDFKVSTSFGEKEVDDKLIGVIQKSAPFPVPPNNENQPMTIGFMFDFNKKFLSAPVTPRSQYIKALRLIKNEYYDYQIGKQIWSNWSLKHTNDLSSFEDSKKAIYEVLSTLNDPRCKLLKPGEQNPFTFSEKSSTTMSEMTRALGYSTMLTSEIGYIRPNEFTHRSIDEWAYELMNVEKCRYLILDLRNNRGGALEPVRRIASMFLKEGKIIYRLKKNKSSEVISAEKDMLIFKGKMVILVNELTGSSAEIIASALKYNNRVKILGTRTQGLGQLTSTFRLPDFYRLVLCTQEIYTPADKKLNDGINPDTHITLSSEQIRIGKGPWWNYFVIPQPLESLPFENDIQLMLALRTLKNL